MFATALGVGILLDATVVRALLLPALVSVFGKWNWWLPDRAARALVVKAPPAPERRETLDDELVEAGSAAGDG